MRILALADVESPALWDYFNPERLKDIDCFKLHWSIVPFKDLPEKERDKDRDVIGNMKKILNLGPSTLD